MVLDDIIRRSGGELPCRLGCLVEDGPTPAGAGCNKRWPGSAGPGLRPGWTVPVTFVPSEKPIPKRNSRTLSEGTGTHGLTGLWVLSTGRAF
jgi:hypothetical protein